MAEKKKIECEKKKREINLSIMLAFTVIIALIVSLTVLFAYISLSTMEKNTVKSGDTVGIAYRVSQSGTLIYEGNLSFKVGSEQLIKGVENAVIGMKVGESKSFTVPPELGYGNYSDSKIFNFTMDEFYESFGYVENAEINDTVEMFVQSLGEEPVINKSYEITGIPWPVRITKIEGDRVFARQEPQNGMVFTSPYYYTGNYFVVVEGDLIKVRPIAEKGQSILTTLGSAKIIGTGLDYVSLDFNSPFAGKTLECEITVLNVTKTA
jgi:FKBP-type peptidyl-prolyl cis-trans isomerase 2